MRRLLAWLLLLFFLAIAAAGGALYLGLSRFQAPGPTTAESTIVVPRGSGVSAIAEQLRGAGIIEDPLVFKLGVRLLADGPLRAGEYRIPPRASAREVMMMMLDGKTVVRRLTVPEGLTTAEILDLVRRASGLEGDTPPVAPGEGTLLPETYHYSLGDSRPELIERMARAMQQTLEELWSRRADHLPLDAPQQAVTLASIVEKETAVAAERPRVAAVFLNRLRQGMPLQADPTVIYALTNGRSSLPRPLTRADLRVDSAYNTYVNAGLPPGPIANPGRASLEAVLNPMDTDDLYFVADGSGGHAFSESLGQHEQNVARWRQVEAARRPEADRQPAQTQEALAAPDEITEEAELPPAAESGGVDDGVVTPAEAVGPPRRKPARAEASP